MLLIFDFTQNNCVKVLYPKDSFNMDGTFPTDLAKSETMRGSKMLLKSLLNKLK